MSIIKDIYEFNEKVRGAKQPSQPTQLSPDDHISRAAFMGEEVLEFTEARTPEEELDALIDVIYFAVGGMYDLGLSVEQAHDAIRKVHAANMSKVSGKKKGRNVKTKDAAKPKEWVEPDLGSYF